MTKIWYFQVPWNNLTFYPNCKVLLEMQFPYKWNSKNRYDDQIVPTIGIPKIGVYPGIVHIYGIQKIELTARFLEFHQLGLLLHFEIVQILGWFVESKTIICVHFSPLFFPFFFSLSPLYEYNSKVYLGKVGFAVLCFSQLNGMDGLYSLFTLCRYYYQCNTNTALSFRALHCFSICTIDYSSYFRVCKVFVASKCCIIIIIIEFDCI